MGIQGLLPLLKSIMAPIHIKELEGCSVAIDTYSWLHKGALSCSTDLCKGQPTSKHIDYCMHRVNMLRHYGIKPILVFDGGPLPMKSDQEIKRARSRKENLSRAKEHELNGNKSAAYECYQKAVDISPLIAYDLIQVLKQESVSYIVAPYEADAQMTFLALSKRVEAVITEDSDLIAFGCPRIIYKMDKFGQGVEFKNSMIQHNKELNLAGFTQMMLLEMCILSGCDYLQSLPGMGLKKAHALIKKYKSYEKVIKHLKYSSIEVPPLYEESFKKAISTFRYQRVYDPVTDDIVHLSEPVDVMSDDLDFLGPLLPQHVAQGIARGDLDPITKLPIQRESESPEKVLHGTYQLKNFKPDVERRNIDLPAQKNLLTNYFCFASLEAKKQFKAPRITPYHPNENNGISSPHGDVDEAKCGTNVDCLDLPKTQDHGPYDNRGVADCDNVQPFMTLQSSVCKPCTSLDKDYDSGENGKARSRNKNVIVKSSYFLNKSMNENHKENKSDADNICDNENIVSNRVCKPPSALLEGACKKEERRVSVRSSYFRHKNNKLNDKSESKNPLVEYHVKTQKSDSGAGDYQMTVDNRKDRMRSSLFQKISVNENNENPESEDLETRGGGATETCNYSIHGSPSVGNSLESTMKKRKIAQTDSAKDDANDIYLGSGMYTSDLEEEETITDERKFGCNINHLDQYSNIAERSIESFVSVISSFRYNSSGSRASGLRPPLKDIKNNCMKSSMPGVDLNKFVYAPTKQKATPGPNMSYK